MTAGARVAAFAALLAAIFAVALLVGRSAEIDSGRAAGDGRDAGHGERAGAAADAAATGTRVDAATTRLSVGATAPWTFRIADARDATVRGFELEQGRRMHLIVVRRDLRHYQHLHPVPAAGGRWIVPLRLPAPGIYHAFADFRAGGARQVVGIDVVAAGPFEPRPLPPPAPLARVDGYEVALRQAPGDALTFAVRRDGAPVSDLQPYLGARGHLIALRAGDLTYAHAHPEGGDPAAGEIAFASGAHGRGEHRLFLQFRHGGSVHTAAFTRELGR